LRPGIPVERGHAFRLKAALMAVIDHFEEIARWSPVSGASPSVRPRQPSRMSATGLFGVAVRRTRFPQ
jgi:hypothetical protein